MPVPQLAEALFEAHRHRSTGCLNVIAEGRESQLLLDGGNLVGAEFRSGHRSLPQSLLRAGLIDPAQLDALWAEGQGAGPAAIEALGLPWTQACEIHTLSQVEGLSESATHVHFEPGKVSNAFTRIRGERVIRAAWLGSDGGGAEEWTYRCIDAEKCERWLLSDAERQFVQGFHSFKSAAEATPAQRALLELLTRDGAVERMRAPAPAPPLEPDAASEVSWATLLDDNPPVVPIAPAQEPRPVSIAPTDKPRAVISIAATDKPRAMVSTTPSEKPGEVVSIAPIEKPRPALSIAPTDDPTSIISRPSNEVCDISGPRGPQLSHTSSDATDTPVSAVSRASPVDWIAAIDSHPPVASIENRPSDDPMRMIEDHPPVEPIAAIDEHPPVASIKDRPPAIPSDPIGVYPPVARIDPMRMIDDRLPAVPSVPIGVHPPVARIAPIPSATQEHTRTAKPAPPKAAARGAVWVEAGPAKASDRLQAIRAAQLAQASAIRNEPISELEQALRRASAALAERGLSNEDIGAIGPLLSASAQAETFSDDEENVADDPSNPDQAARARRQRLLRRAVENIGGLGPRPVEAAGLSMENSGHEPAPAPPSSPGIPSANEMELVASLERKFHQIETHADCFALLGVPRTATTDEVKAAFLELAKVFHPDRLPASLHHLLSKMRAVFESVREAYETLQNESSRAIYEAGRVAEKPPTENKLSPAQEAAEAYKRGETLFRKRDYAGAELEYHRAHFLDSKANYLAAEAWAIHLNPERREQAPLAKQMMIEAAKKDPNCERAQYQLGVIARVEGDMDRAEKHFREAVRLSPRHLEANQELRLIQMRKKKGRTR